METDIETQKEQKYRCRWEKQLLICICVGQEMSWVFEGKPGKYFGKEVLTYSVGFSQKVS